ncbi:P-selectin-like [Branchiostoma floridae]|uniref:P-selectin-like n=1 Tax=Branchiostoma floridae TaxID=7739 RepID=A0A9J7KS29_BRAFL|nr:P-selectin-like [Branchiostoma floridae]
MGRQLQCPALPNPINGALSPTGVATNQTVVTFSCNTGYVLIGAATTTCQADERWSNPVPTCTPRECPPLTAPANGMRTPTTRSNFYTNTITFTCNSGYVLSGVSPLTCRADGTWSNTIPTCGRRQCPVLTATANGVRTPATGSNFYTDMITFTCDTGYQLNGVSTLTCQADGTWSGNAPTCTSSGTGSGIQCQALTAPTNGALNPSAGPYVSQQEVTFTCNTGYQLSGSSTSRCRADGTWSSAVPTCTLPQVSTSPASVSPPTVCSPICGVLASCVLTNGTARCVCNTGFKGDGFTCSDVDECSTSPCTGPNEHCKNRPGSFDCVCLPIYIRWGDDDNCTATSRHNIDVTYTDNFDYNPDQHDGNSNGFHAERRRHMNEFDDLVDDWVDNVPDVDKVATPFNNFRSGSLIANNDVMLAGKPLSSAQVQEGLNRRITSDPNSNFLQVTAKPYDYCGDSNTQDACYSRDYCTNTDTGGFTCRCPTTHIDDSPDGLPGRNCNTEAVYEDVRTPGMAVSQRSETGSDVYSYPMAPLPVPPLPSQPSGHYQELRPAVYQSLQRHQRVCVN